MMKHPHHLRNFSLIGIGVVGLAMLVPSDERGTVAAPQAQRSILATSPELANYLEARLRSVATRSIVTSKASFGETITVSRPSGQSVAVEDPLTAAPAVQQFNSLSSSALNVRAGPGKNTASLFVLQPGTPVRIDLIKGNWANIFTVDGTTGWAYAPLLAKAQPQVGIDSDEPRVGNSGQQPDLKGTKPAVPVAAASAVEKTLGEEPRVVIGEGTEPHSTSTRAKHFRLANNTVLRSAPTKGSSKLLVVEGGSKLLVAEWDGQWARVILSDGTSGWINVR